MNRSAVIYAAGKGTRFEGLPENESKCVVRFPLNKDGSSYITPLTATINACLSRGIYDFHVVIGYGKSSVIAECDRITRIYGKEKIKITFVENTKWDFHGCEYSVNLGLRSALKNNPDEIFLIEGDSLVAPEVLGRLIDVPHSAILVRPYEAIDPKRSVVAYSKLGSGIVVEKFWYDSTHTAEELPAYIKDDAGACYESGQVWKLLPNEYLKELVDSYLDLLDVSKDPDTQCGLSTLGKYGEKYCYYPVFIPVGEGVYNINTKEDYEAMKKVLVLPQ